MCIIKNCKIIPYYNFEGETKAIYCTSHKSNGMINIISKTCEFEGCKTIPVYNFEGETKAIYCASHKSDGMINIKNKPCEFEGCKTIPTYNFEGETKAIYCTSHKSDGMINVKNKTCEFEGCKKQPAYNFEGETKAIYCTSHKFGGMINIINKTCEFEGCKKQPIYNFEGETKAIYCTSHKSDGMIDIKNKTCKSIWCNTHVSEKYDGYCLYCYINLFPNKPVVRNYKTKEYSVIEFIKLNFPNIDWKTDKQITDGCSKRRPDAMLDLGYQVLIIEVDENQHINYDCSCENKRIMELSQDVGHRPIVFIRFNPDEYNKSNKLVSSCWSNNKNGICVVKKTKEKEWNDRLMSLKEQINYWINPKNYSNKIVEIIELYYDGFIV